MLSVPAHLLRNAAVYRSWGEPAQRIGAGFWTAPPGYAARGAIGDWWALILVLRGRGRINGRAVHAGEAFTRHPGTPDDFAADEGYAECWLDLGGALREVPARFGLSRPGEDLLRPGIDLALVRRWHRLAGRIRAATEESLPVLGAELLALAAELVAASRRLADDPYAALVAEARQLLEQGARRDQLEDLARRHRLSFERLRKLFRSHVGLAPGAYRQRRRMDHARELLRAGDLTVTEIAHALGCASAATFSAQFKADAGLPPQRWRRAQKR